MNDAELAAHLAADAGRILLEVRESGRHHGKDLGRAGDAEANAVLVAALRELRPDDGLLSEEEKDNLDRLSLSRTWIVDPVDGTREYGEARSDWAVRVQAQHPTNQPTARIRAQATSSKGPDRLLASAC